ncbi:MAG: SCO family protein, partial [Phycisphaerae bacterium]
DIIRRLRGLLAVRPAGGTPALRAQLRRWSVLGIFVLALGLGLATVRAQSAPAPDAAAGPAPAGFTDAVVVAKADARVPLDLEFVDEEGQTVALRQYFAAGKPVIVAMVYYECPMLCGLTLNGLLEGIRPLPLALGKDYQIITVSFIPKEKPSMAKSKKAKFIDALGWSGTQATNAAAGWHFLTTPSDEPAQALGQALGFGYKYDFINKQYLHQAAIYICMPDGRVSRLIADVHFETKMLQDSLTHASQGQIGSPLLQFARFCGLVHFDEGTGKFVAVAKNIVRAGGLLTVLLLGGFLGYFWYREHKKHQASPPAPPAAAGG